MAPGKGTLWASDDSRRWAAAVERYEDVVDLQGVESLPELDRWYRTALPEALASRQPPFVSHEELLRVTKWKMSRGVWRGRNLALVKGNSPEDVVETSRAALDLMPDPKAPIRELSRLAGVGPATASAVLAAAEPGLYPFFDDIVAAQLPGIGKIAFTPSFYARYADALRERARALGTGWTPAQVERALWSHAGGKAAAENRKPS